MKHKEIDGWAGADDDYRLKEAERQALATANGYTVRTAGEQNHLTANNPYSFWQGLFRGRDDGVADSSEAATWTVLSDTWNVAGTLGAGYWKDGDDELLARRAENDPNAAGDRTKDWAHNGFQAAGVPPVQVAAFLPATQAKSVAAEPRQNVSSVNVDSLGPAGLLAPSTGFSGTFSDAPVDFDADLIYDALLITAGIEVEEAGTYYIAADLYDGEEHSVGYVFQEIQLAAGANSAQIQFDRQPRGP